jgi:hypothetical protein
MALTAKQQSIKDEFIRVRNTWAPQWESILRAAPDFLLAYLKLSAVPLTHNHLEDKVDPRWYLWVI